VTADIALEGDRTLAATLAAASAEIRHLDQSENARLIASRAQARAPKRTGRLARSVRASDLGGGEAAVQSDLIYAPVIHYGWAAHNIAPQPFLTSAVADSTRVVEANSLRDVRSILGHVRGA